MLNKNASWQNTFVHNISKKYYHAQREPEDNKKATWLKKDVFVVWKKSLFFRNEVLFRLKFKSGLTENIELFWRSSRELFEFKLSRNSDIGPWDVIHRSSCSLLWRRSLVSRFYPWSEDAVVVEFGAPLFGSALGSLSGEIFSASLFSALDDVLLSELSEPSLLSSLLAERDSLLWRFWRRFFCSSTDWSTPLEK